MAMAPRRPALLLAMGAWAQRRGDPEQKGNLSHPDDSPWSIGVAATCGLIRAALGRVGDEDEEMARYYHSTTGARYRYRQRDVRAQKDIGPMHCFIQRMAHEGRAASPPNQPKRSCHGPVHLGSHCFLLLPVFCLVEYFQRSTDITGRLCDLIDLLSYFSLKTSSG